MRNLTKNETGFVFQNLFLNTKTGESISPVITENYELLQVADSYFVRRRECSEHHQHCDIELTYSLYSELTSSADGIECRLGKQDAYISLRGEKHGIRSKSRSRYQTLAVNAKSDNAKRLISDICKKFEDKKSRAIHIPEIASGMTDIVSEFIADDAPHSLMLIDAAITSVLVAILRSSKDGASARLDISNKELMPNLLNYIDDNFLTVSKISDISARFGYTHNYLCRIFKEKNGITLIKYLNTKKLEYAAERLNSGASCQDIAETLGYSDSSNFSRAFKNHFGISPDGYINKK